MLKFSGQSQWLKQKHTASILIPQRIQTRYSTKHVKIKIVAESIEVTIKRIGNVSANIYLVGMECDENPTDEANAYLILVILILLVILVYLKWLENNFL